MPILMDGKLVIITRQQMLDLKLKFYYTGKLCRNGHDSVWRKDGGCRQCCKCAPEWPKGFAEKYRDALAGKEATERMSRMSAAPWQWITPAYTWYMAWLEANLT